MSTTISITIHHCTDALARSVLAAVRFEELGGELAEAPVDEAAEPIDDDELFRRLVNDWRAEQVPPIPPTIAAPPAATSAAAELSDAKILYRLVDEFFVPRSLPFGAARVAMLKAYLDKPWPLSVAARETLERIRLRLLGKGQTRKHFPIYRAARDQLRVWIDARA